LQQLLQQQMRQVEANAHCSQTLTLQTKEAG
jgi:hypothetical protein